MSNSVGEEGEKSENPLPPSANEIAADQPAISVKDENERGPSVNGADDTRPPPTETPPNSPAKPSAQDVTPDPTVKMAETVNGSEVQIPTNAPPATDDLPVTSTPKTPTSGETPTRNASSDVPEVAASAVTTTTTTSATDAVNAALSAAAAKEKSKKKKKSSAGETLPANAGRVGSGIEIIRIKEKHGQFRKAVPIMPLPLAIALCLVNVVLPGIGTLFSAFTVFCCGKTEFESKGKAFSLNITAAILQIVTIPIIVGWIWSIIWGVTFITTALSKDSDKDEDCPAPQQV